MTGKIARLPHEIRSQLNQRLRNGEQGKTIVKWLNALPEVKIILAADFNGHPIRKQNLSEWKNHGYRKWLEHQEAQEILGEMVVEGEELKVRLGESVTDKLAGWLIPHYVAEARAKLAAARNTDERYAAFRTLCADLVPLRRGDHYARKLRLEEERLEVTRRLTKEQEEERHLEWLKRPDIQKKVHPKVSRDRAVGRIRQIMDHFMMGKPLEDFEYLDDEEPEPPQDPAAMI